MTRIIFMSILICCILICISIYILHKNKRVNDFAKICYATPYQIIYPKNEIEILDAIKNSTKRICIAGGKYSHGGQTMLDDSIYIDTKYLNNIISLNPGSVKVQSGITWKDLQIFLDQYDLSIAEMQSYRNFSVGGSISVNCHGRGLEYGTIADTVISLTVITADGDFVIADKDNNYDLFRAVIGGYGGIGFIYDCTLLTGRNFQIERKIITTSLDVNKIQQIVTNQNSVLYNARIMVESDINIDKIIHVCWFKTRKPLTNSRRLRQDIKYPIANIFMGTSVSNFASSRKIRSEVDLSQFKHKLITWKNYEMSYDTNDLKLLTKRWTTNILQEYFIPISDDGSLREFLKYFKKMVVLYDIKIINISLRYVKKTDIPILNYAPVDSIAVVLYININNNDSGLFLTKKWTQLLIDKSLATGGKFYLPYLILFTHEQFLTAYPDYITYKKIKNKYDPSNRFSNCLLEYCSQS